MVYATVNGTEITKKQVDEKIKGQIEVLRQQERQLIEAATNDLIEKTLLEQAAKSRGVSVQRLFDSILRERERPVSKDEIKSFMDQNGITGKKLSKQELDSLPSIIKSHREMAAREKLLTDLYSKAKIVMEIEGLDQSTKVKSPGVSDKVDSK